jgi:hypothetical protein
MPIHADSEAAVPPVGGAGALALPKRLNFSAFLLPSVFHPFQNIRGLLRLASRVGAYRERHGQLPQSLQQVTGEAPKDAWGHDYLYETQEGKWLIKSLGYNGVDDGAGFDDFVSMHTYLLIKDQIVHEGMSENRVKLLLDGGFTTRHGVRLDANGRVSTGKPASTDDGATRKDAKTEF